MVARMQARGKRAFGNIPRQAVAVDRLPSDEGAAVESRGSGPGSGPDSGPDYGVADIEAELEMLGDPFNSGHAQRTFENIEGRNNRSSTPLPHHELRRTFDELLANKQRRHTDTTFEQIFSRDAVVRIGPDGRRLPPMGFRLVIRDTKPRTCLLYMPLWEGALEMPLVDILVVRQIKLQAVEQKNKVLPVKFKKVWNGTKDDGSDSLANQMMQAREYEAAPMEEHRDKVIASLLLEQLRVADAKDNRLKAGQDPDERGRPQKMPDGSVVFVFGEVWDSWLAHGPDRVTRNEMSKCMAFAGAATFKPSGSASGRDFKRITAAGVAKLEELAT